MVLTSITFDCNNVSEKKIASVWRGNATFTIFHAK